MFNPKNITAAREALKVLMRPMKARAPVRQIIVFLWIAEREPVTLAETARNLGLPAGTVYDDLRALGKVAASGKAGAQLINELPAGPNNPAHQYVLTVRGQQVLEALHFRMAGALLDPD